MQQAIENVNKTRQPVIEVEYNNAVADFIRQLKEQPLKETYSYTIRSGQLVAQEVTHKFIEDGIDAKCNPPDYLGGGYCVFITIPYKKNL